MTMFRTTSYKRKLPVPFFEVLDQEYAALHATEPAKFSWEFEPSHLKDASSEFIAKIKPLLLTSEQPHLGEDCSKAELAQALNHLIHSSRCIYFDRQFPRAALTKESVAMTGLKLEASEHTRLNRLLLEDAFPEHIRKLEDIHLATIYRRIHESSGQTALCFSGGGIRSATFALGVTQGLAKRGLMGRFDYLSTVSGGGYIGSWLSSWIHHAGDPEKVFAQLRETRPESVTDPEPKPLSHLRKYSNYLTPKLGMFSADTWVLIGTYLRNLILNWMVFIPILLALCAVPRFVVSALHGRPPGWLVTGVFITGIIATIWAMAYNAMNRPTVRADLKEHGGSWYAHRGQESFLVWCLAPLGLAAICLTTGWSWVQNGVVDADNNAILQMIIQVICGTIGQDEPRVWNYCALGAVTHLAGWLIAEWFLKRWRRGRLSVVCKESVIVAITGAAGGFLLWALASFTYRCVCDMPGLALYNCFAVPAFLLTFHAAETLFVGVSSNITTEEDREWWARMGAWLLIAMVGWMVSAAVVLFGPLALIAFPAWLGGMGGVSGLFTLIMGHSAASAAGKKDGGQKGWLPWVLEKALGLAAPVAILALVAGLSLVTSWLLVVAAGWLPMIKGGWLREALPAHTFNWMRAHRGVLPGFSELNAFTCFDQVVHDAPWWLTGGFIAVCALMGYGLSRFININRFSLHSIYRNRLVRAYPGASNSKRDPNPFTGFDPSDNLRLQELRDPEDSTRPQRPLHIVNMALNLVTGENLAWQQRKAETFTASTLHCGNYRLGYRMTKHYALNEKKMGLSLGTAVAVSGAAASPNQGYHSSATVALLMTFFNVRLGWWLGNPGAAGHATFHDSSPKSPVLHFVKEGLGLTDSTSPYVYLSDGGHFENLGLYEMILRRCHLIVLSDAGCDPTCNLEDLGNAIRKIRIDLGVEIRIKKFGIYSRIDEAGKKEGKCCAVADIDYGGIDEGGRMGTLVYFKPALCGDEPRDVFNYSRSSEEFPHESTSDQWFNESQFESYRALGLHTIDRLYQEPLRAQPKVGQREDELADFVARACQYADLPLPDRWQSEFEIKPPPGAEVNKG